MREARVQNPAVMGGVIRALAATSHIKVLSRRVHDVKEKVLTPTPAARFHVPRFAVLKLYRSAGLRKQYTCLGRIPIRVALVVVGLRGLEPPPTGSGFPVTK